MSNLKKILALVLALVMVFALAACGESSAPAETPAEAPAETPAEAPAEQEAPAEEAAEAPANNTLVYATSTFGQNFSPFFYTTAYDGEVVDMVRIGLLAADRGGAVIENGIEGLDVDYNGTAYNYKGAGNV